MKKTIIAILFLSFSLADFSSVKAETDATTILSGGGSLRGNYNITNKNEDTIDSWDSSASAFLTLNHSRRSQNGSFSVGYRQSFSYDFRTEEFSAASDDVRFNLNTWRNLSSRLRFNLSNTFVATNDLWAEWLSPYSTGIPDPEDLTEDGEDETAVDQTARDEQTLSTKIGREKFWTNNLSAGLNYQYAINGSVGLSYGNTILEYDEDNTNNLNNYIRNSVSVSISQVLGPQWSSGLSYRFTDADFEFTEDSTSHSAGFNLGYTHSPRDSFSVGVNYHETNYDTDDPGPINRNNNFDASASIRWGHTLSETKSLSMSAGPSFYHEDGRDDRTSANFSINFSSSFENGSWSLGANGGYTDRSFDGADANRGKSESQSIRIGANKQLAENISGSLGASIRTDDFLQNPLENDEKTYSAHANLSYRLSRLFHVSGRYWYSQFDTDLGINDYEEHRFFVTLGASRELYRWFH